MGAKVNIIKYFIQILLEIYIISVMKSLVGNYKSLNYKDFCYKKNI